MSDLVDKIIDFEAGNLDEQATLEFFQQLVDSGLAWTLQGNYGRQAQTLINEGLINE